MVNEKRAGEKLTSELDVQSGEIELDSEELLSHRLVVVTDRVLKVIESLEKNT